MDDETGRSDVRVNCGKKIRVDDSDKTLNFLLYDSSGVGSGAGSGVESGVESGAVRL